MYHILPEVYHDIIAIRVEGSMSSQEYKTLIPHIKRRLEQQSRIRVLFELNNIEDGENLGILKIIYFSFRYNKQIEKKAIITDEKWIYTCIKILSPFFKTKVRCFPRTEVEDGWEWVRK